MSNRKRSADSDPSTSYKMRTVSISTFNKWKMQFEQEHNIVGRGPPFAFPTMRRAGHTQLNTIRYPGYVAMLTKMTILLLNCYGAKHVEHTRKRLQE